MAVRRWVLACVILSMPGCRYGQNLEVPDKPVTDREEQARCDPADKSDCIKLGRMLRFGQPPGRNENRAKAVFRYACEHSNLDACVNLADMLSEDKATIGEATEVLRKSCEGDYAFACVQLGNLYLSGRMVSKEFDKARSLFEKACREMRKPQRSKRWEMEPMDQAYGCDNLGTMYENGWSVEKDYERAYRLALFACENGWGTGCNQVGVFISRGWVEDRDPSEMLNFFMKSCDSAFMGQMGCCNAATYLKERNMTTPDGRDAAYFLEKARNMQFLCPDRERTDREP